MPTLYKSIPDGFKTVYRTQGLRGFTIVSYPPTLSSVIVKLVFRDGPPL